MERWKKWNILRSIFFGGKGYYSELRFVLVKYQGKCTILVSTKLDLGPTSMIELYAYRFKIECTFRELKQVIGGFSYQFWSKSMPKLKRYLKHILLRK
ncbi:hypothetical protein [Marinisporobacter balticus]|uniref:hypothetical protein n=1 Tax=Marinisporobacter balticus TaxID=2018667 RepID=UPI00104E2E33